MIVQPEEGHIRPRRLVVVRRPVGERAGNPDAPPIVQLPHPAAVLHPHPIGARRRREHGAVRLWRRGQLVERAARYPVFDTGQLIRREDRVPERVRIVAARLAIRHILVDPVEPVRVIADPVAILRRGAQHEFHHHAHPQAVSGFYKPGKQRVDVQTERRLSQIGVELVRVADPIGRPECAFLAILPHRGDG